MKGGGRVPRRRRRSHRLCQSLKTHPTLKRQGCEGGRGGGEYKNKNRDASLQHGAGARAHKLTVLLNSSARKNPNTPGHERLERAGGFSTRAICLSSSLLLYFFFPSRTQNNLEVGKAARSSAPLRCRKTLVSSVTDCLAARVPPICCAQPPQERASPSHSDLRETPTGCCDVTPNQKKVP